jgi:hypothetical protein
VEAALRNPGDNKKRFCHVVNSVSTNAEPVALGIGAAGFAMGDERYAWWALGMLALGVVTGVIGDVLWWQEYGDE